MIGKYFTETSNKVKRVKRVRIDPAQPVICNFALNAFLIILGRGKLHLVQWKKLA